MFNESLALRRHGTSLVIILCLAQVALGSITVRFEPADDTHLLGEVFTIDQGALRFFSEQTLALYLFYEKDRALAQAFLKNALFEFGFFETQLNEFIDKVGGLLQFELAGKNEQQRLIIAKAWMGFYFLTLISGLTDENSTAQEWHQSLLEQCQMLLEVSH